MELESMIVVLLAFDFGFAVLESLICVSRSDFDV